MGKLLIIKNADFSQYAIDEITPPAPGQFTITVSVDPSGSGTVTGAGNYNEGATVTLSATPNTGYVFVNYTKNGVEVSTNATYSFTVTGNASYVANFTEAASYSWAYGFTDAQLNNCTQNAQISTGGYTHRNQSAIQGKTITGIKIKTGTFTGTISIWVYDGGSIPTGAPVDSSKIIDKTTISTTGDGTIQTFRFNEPFTLGEEQMLVVGKNTDSGDYKFGAVQLPGTNGCYTNLNTSQNVSTATVYVGFDIEILD